MAHFSLFSAEKSSFVFLGSKWWNYLIGDLTTLLSAQYYKFCCKCLDGPFQMSRSIGNGMEQEGVELEVAGDES